VGGGQRAVGKGLAVAGVEQRGLGCVCCGAALDGSRWIKEQILAISAARVESGASSGPFPILATEPITFGYQIRRVGGSVQELFRKPLDLSS
jgi:hypothetical protein